MRRLKGLFILNEETRDLIYGPEERRAIADLVSISTMIGIAGRTTWVGAVIPKQEQFVFDNVRVIHDQPTHFLSIGTPVDVLTITHSSFKTAGSTSMATRRCPTA